MMYNEETNLRERFGTENPFRVPEGYFEQFAARMMEQLPERKPKSRLVALRPWLYAAACVVAVVVMGITLHLRQDASDDQQTAVIATVDNAFMDDAADYAMIDNMEIYACLSDN